MPHKYWLKEQPKTVFSKVRIEHGKKIIFKTFVYLRKGTKLSACCRKSKLEMAFSEINLVTLTQLNILWP